MDSLVTYGSDEENNYDDEIKPGVDPDVELDVNYDIVTMDMSEESDGEQNHPQHHDSPPRGKDSPPERKSLYNDKRYGNKREEDEELDRNRKKSRSKSPDRYRNRESEDRSSKKRRPSSSREDYERDRRDRRERDYRRHSRSPHGRGDRRRSRSPRDRRHSRREPSPSRRHRDRDRSRSPRKSNYERKANRMNTSEDASKESGVPSYYNPGSINPAKYAAQMAKRKLLWSKSKPEGPDNGAPSDSSRGNLWKGATFSQDQDGKMSAKFQRLMGIKQPDSSKGESSTSNAEAKGKDLIKKQEELFSSMELQYEMARAATHTQRGVGLGFGAHYPR